MILELEFYANVAYEAPYLLTIGKIKMLFSLTQFSVPSV